MSRPPSILERHYRQEMQDRWHDYIMAQDYTPRTTLEAAQITRCLRDYQAARHQYYRIHRGRLREAG